MKKIIEARIQQFIMLHSFSFIYHVESLNKNSSMLRTKSNPVENILKNGEWEKMKFDGIGRRRELP